MPRGKSSLLKWCTYNVHLIHYLQIQANLFPFFENILLVLLVDKQFELTEQIYTEPRAYINGTK